MADLAQGKCEECAPGTPPLDAGKVQALAREIDPGWNVEGSQISRELKFDNFREAFGLATKVALLAEEQGHHPDLEVGWGRVKVTLTTHTAKGLTQNDFIMAAKVDKL